MSRAEIQASQYRFPYHWLPVMEDDGAWAVGRHLGWGHEYLGVSTAVREAALRNHPRRVLDVGCGDGRFSHELLTAGVDQVVGVDLEEQAILFARAFNLRMGDRAIFHCGWLSDLSIEPVDVVVAMEVLEHVPIHDMPDLVRSMWDLLAPEGTLVVSVPSTNVPLHPKHERHYTPAALYEHLEPWFEPRDCRFVHRSGFAEQLSRRLFVNRIGLVLDKRINRATTRLYRRYVLQADERNGAHLVAVFARNPRP